MAFPQKHRGGRAMNRPRVRRWLGVAMMSMAVAVFISSVAWAGTTGQISGTVRDGKTGDPLPLVSISIPELKRGAISDAQGGFFITNLPAGKYSVRASLLGYVP